MDVIQPQKKPGVLGSLLPAVGSIIGSYFGPVGSKVGGAVGGAVGKTQQPEQTQNIPQEASWQSEANANQSLAQPQQASWQSEANANQSMPEQSNAMSRYSDKINNDPATQLRQGKAALATMSEQHQKDYGPYLDQALAQEARSRQAQQAQGYTIYDKKGY